MNRHSHITLFTFTLIFAMASNSTASEQNQKPYISHNLLNKIKYMTSHERNITRKIDKSDMHDSNIFGITINEDKIIIDTKKTKDLFGSIMHKLEGSFEKIDSKLKKDQVASVDETGIIIREDIVSIDLNKTKTFLNKWSNSMNSVAEELDKTMSDIEDLLR